MNKLERAIGVHAIEMAIKTLDTCGAAYNRHTGMAYLDVALTIMREAGLPETSDNDEDA